MKITFLGTSSMIPTKTRNHSSIFLQYEGEGILIDCGEGTQRQFRLANISPSKTTKLLISHWHGDHTLGIPGLLQNLRANDYRKTLEIYGPKGTKKYLKNMLSGIAVQKTIKFKVKEISSGIFYKGKSFNLEAITLDHIVPCLAYSLIENDKIKINLDYLKKFNLKQHPILGKLQQGKNITYKGHKILAKKATIPGKGKKVTIIMDTAPCKNAEIIAKNSDLLITECTWKKELKDLVRKRKHLTTELTAKIAKKAKVKQLILTHFSQRYRDVKELENEAKKVFKNTKAAKDLMEIKI
ncbi:MAG: ribonuclease Z [Nanoarchaeota archaeon]|nr:ribonuclease Z [Nanoarchaeota archaeon]|tara:strand:- start:1748 stop:2638 length:891 start_codon:yes stop_codon:yes gene_type:complete